MIRSFTMLASMLLALNAYGASSTNILTQASKLLETDKELSVSNVIKNESKFKTTADKLELANWYYSIGKRTDALRIFEEVYKKDSTSVDAVLGVAIIRDLKFQDHKTISYDLLLPYYESAKRNRHLKYFMYMGYLALELNPEIAPLYFDEVITLSDQPEGYFGLGLAYEKTNTQKAISLYEHLLQERLLNEADNAQIITRLNTLTGRKEFKK